MSGFRTTHHAEINVPQDGFTLEELKAHMSKTKVPRDARLRPAIVGNAMDPGADEVVRFMAEWEE